MNGDLRPYIRTIPDHPKPGIQFRDITTLLALPEGLRAAVDGLARPWVVEEGEPVSGTTSAIDLIVGIEARGFIFGTALAYRLGLGFVPLRKPGKLPGDTIGQEFELEYGHDRIEMHVDVVAPGQRVLLVDDLIATGGTAEAAVALLHSVGAEIVECAFVISLPDLGGARRLESLGCRVRSLCEFAGD